LRLAVTPRGRRRKTSVQALWGTTPGRASNPQRCLVSDRHPCRSRSRAPPVEVIGDLLYPTCLHQFEGLPEAVRGELTVGRRRSEPCAGSRWGNSRLPVSSIAATRATGANRYLTRARPVCPRRLWSHLPVCPPTTSPMCCRGLPTRDAATIQHQAGPDEPPHRRRGARPAARRSPSCPLVILSSNTLTL